MLCSSLPKGFLRASVELSSAFFGLFLEVLIRTDAIECELDECVRDLCLPEQKEGFGCSCLNVWAPPETSLFGGNFAVCVTF